MKRILFILLCLIISITFIQAKSLVISKCSVAPIIDGNGDDDWANVSWINMLENKGEDINKNNTAKFKLTYDNYFLYVFCSVEDNTLDTSQSANWWEKDGIEIFICLDTTGKNLNNCGKGTFYYLSKVYGREITDFKSKNFVVVEESTASGYTQEWKLPWDSLNSTNDGSQIWNTECLRFDITNNDNDGSGRVSQFFWNSNADDQWNSTKNMGYIFLGSEHIKYLNVSQSEFSLGNQAYSKSVSIGSSYLWTAQSSQSWLTLSKSSGTFNDNFNIYATSNTSSKSRVGYITVKAGNLTKTITVTQAGVSSCISDDEYNSVVNELNIAKDSIKMLLDKCANNVMVTIIDNMKEFSTLVDMSGTNVELRLFPNPSKDKIQVECDFPITQVEIFNLEGKKLYSRLSDETSSFIVIDGFEEGLYILKVHTSKGIIGGKFVITK